jgi:hypothetical protein
MVQELVVTLKSKMALVGRDIAINTNHQCVKQIITILLALFIFLNGSFCPHTIQYFAIWANFKVTRTNDGGMFRMDLILSILAILMSYQYIQR